MYVPSQILIATGELFYHRTVRDPRAAAAEIAEKRGLLFRADDDRPDYVAWSEDGKNWFEHIGTTPGGRYRHSEEN